MGKDIKRFFNNKSKASKLIFSVIIAGMILLIAGNGAFAYFKREAADSDFGYGYGYGHDGTGYGYGYGYGYGANISDNENYGFWGLDGKVTVDSTEAEQTSFTINYTTSYLSKNRIEYGTTASLGSFYPTDWPDDYDEVGSNSITVTGLVCETTYYSKVASKDAGDNEWLTGNYNITTSSCGSSTGGSSGVTITPSEEERELTPAELAGLKSQLEEIIKILKAILRQMKALGYTLSPEQEQLIAEEPGLVLSESVNMTLGSTGPAVKALQQFLNNRGFRLAESGPGSPGNETTYFGPLTRAALARFQASVGISPAVGYFGPITRSYLKSIGY